MSHPYLNKLAKSFRHLRAWLKKNRRLTYIIALLLSFLLILSIPTFFYLKELPSPHTLQTNTFPVSTQIMDRHGTLLYEIFDDTQRTPIKLSDIPPHIYQATIAIEDQHFYRHLGFSFSGIIRAIRNNLLSDSLQGGSTITQQLVKNTLLTPERTIERKFKEAILTLATEFLYSKDQILELYLNHVPYGGTAYGIEAASQKFFGIHVTELNLAQSSLLAGLPQAPTRFSPFTNPERAKARQHEVLRRMVEDGYITQTEADLAFETSLSYIPPDTAIKAPHFVFYIKSILEEQYGLQTVERGGLRVITSLDLNLQNYAQASVSAHVQSLANRKVTNGASLVTNPASGEILAMIGSQNYFDTDNDGQVNLTNRLRQPGSSIKPLNYVTSMQLGVLRPNSVLFDIPTCFSAQNQPNYCPKNYDGGFRGPVTLRQALANSYNIPAVKTLALNSLESFIATSSAMGISTFTDPSRYGLSLTLGGGEVTMLDMALSFGTLANQGVKVPLLPILKVTNHQGEVLFEANPEEIQQTLSLFNEDLSLELASPSASINTLTRVLHRQPAYLMWHILSDDAARAPVFGRNSDLTVRGYQVAAKTGTTNDHKDSWTIGYTPQFVTVSWVGNNDNSSMSAVAGATGAAPIFNSIMSYLLLPTDQEASTMPEPPDIAGTNVCGTSGRFPIDANPCPLVYDLYWERFPQTEFHPELQNVWINVETGQPLLNQNPNDPPPETDNLQLNTHTIVTDGITKDFCLDCNWVNPETLKPAYPTTQVKM